MCVYCAIKTKFIWSSIKVNKIKGSRHFNGLVYSLNKYADNVVKCLIFSRILAIKDTNPIWEWSFDIRKLYHLAAENIQETSTLDFTDIEGQNIKQTMEILIGLELKHFVCMAGNNYYALAMQVIPD